MKILKTTLSYHVLIAVLQHSNLTVIQQIKNSQPLKGHRILLIKMTKAKNRQKKTNNIYVTSFVVFFFQKHFLHHTCIEPFSEKRMFCDLYSFQ